ncbi:MAG: hypothetical protein AAF531_19140 [Actinomycetota bacterium]
MTRTMLRLAAALGVLAGCGGGADAADSGGAAFIVGAEDIRFDSDEYRLPAGEVTIELVQEGVLPHSLLIEDADGNALDFRLLVNAAELSDAGSVTLDAGSYVFFCDIAGHRAAGMESVVVVGGG